MKVFDFLWGKVLKDLTEGDDTMPERPTDTVTHQDEHEAIIDERVADALDGAGAANTAIDDLDAITGGQAPTEDEHNLVVTAVNDILAALRNSGIIPSE